MSVETNSHNYTNMNLIFSQFVARQNFKKKESRSPRGFLSSKNEFVSSLLDSGSRESFSTRTVRLFCFLFVKTLQKNYQRSSIPDGSKIVCFLSPEFFTLFKTPGAGIEPATNRLTGDCSTAELSRNKLLKLPMDFNPYLSRLQPKIILKDR